MSPFAAGGALSCHLGSGKGAAARQPRLARCNNAAPNVYEPYARVVHGRLILALPPIVKAKNGAGKPPAPQLRSIDHLGLYTHNRGKKAFERVADLRHTSGTPQPPPRRARGKCQVASKRGSGKARRVAANE